jgi:SRSO17 transposase
LVEWPEDEEKPTRNWLSNLPKSTSLKHLVYAAKMHWHIKRDYQQLMDELGLNHYEGRNWRGCHHHATLCIAAYAYLVAQRLEGSSSLKKTPENAKNLPYPTITSSGVLQSSQRHVRDLIDAEIGRNHG